jgi:hypothetical protein
MNYLIYHKLANEPKNVQIQFDTFCSEIANDLIQKSKSIKFLTFDKHQDLLIYKTSFHKEKIFSDDLLVLLYVKYYRAMSLFILESVEVRKELMQIALETNSVVAIKVLQKAINCDKLDSYGVIGPVTRSLMNEVTLEKLLDIKNTLWYKYQLLINKF